MNEALREYLALPPEDLTRHVDLEDLATALAIRDSYDEGAPERAAWDFLPKFIDNWIETTPALPFKNLGVRCQPIIRIVFDKSLSDEASAKWSRWEIDILVALQSLLKRLPPEDQFVRTRELSAINAEELPILVQAFKRDPGLSEMQETMQLVSPQSLRKAKRISASDFAGIGQPFLGPVTQATATTKVLGYIPDNCALVCPEFSCTVRGAVYGALAATYDCDISDNIGGVVVSGKGHIFGRRIVIRAKVIAKLGNIRAEACEDPAIVYSGSDLHIRGDIRLGNYAAPALKVDGKVTGGSITITELAEAAELRPLGSRELSLRLTNQLSPSLYGKTPERDANRVMLRSSAIRRHIQHEQSIINMLEDEQEQHSSNALIYITHAEVTEDEVMKFSSQQNKLSQLERAIASIDSLIKDAQSRLLRHADGEDADELSMYSFDEEDWEPELEVYQNHLNTISREVRGENPILPARLEELKHQQSEWNEDYLKLRNELARHQEKIAASLEKLEFTREGEGGTRRVAMLHRVISAARKDKDNESARNRMETTFFKVILRKILRLKKHIEIHQGKIDSMHSEHEALRETLKTNHYMTLSQDHADAAFTPYISGSFREGVLLEKEDILEEEFGRLVTENSNGEVVKYQFLDDRIAVGQ